MENNDIKEKLNENGDIQEKSINDKSQIPDDKSHIPEDNQDKDAVEEKELSMDELLEMQSGISDKIYDKEVVLVKVVHVSEDAVFVDAGEKKEAIIPVSDFEKENLPSAGSKIPALLAKKGKEGGHTVLSYKRAKEQIAWDYCKKAFEEKTRLKGRILEMVKGGYIVDACGLNAFMPMSLSEFGGAYKHCLPVNAKIKFYIIEMSVKEKKIIVSRRLALEEDEKERRKKIFSEVSPGKVIRAVVSKGINSGMFVRFDGIEGFIKIADIAWKNPEEAIKNFKRGQRIKCKILALDRESEKISFGIKQLTPNPADVLKKRFPFRSLLRAKVTEVSKDGAKVSVDKNTEGFVSETEFGASGSPRAGDNVKAAVIGINHSSFELVLSIKKFEEMEDRKKMQQYLKKSPSLTLGQILENSEDNDIE